MFFVCRVSYPWAVTKKSATINDSGFGCRDTSLLELLTGLEPVTSSLPTNQEMPKNRRLQGKCSTNVPLTFLALTFLSLVLLRPALSDCIYLPLFHTWHDR